MSTIKRVTKFLEQVQSRYEESHLVLFHVNVAGRKSVVWRDEKWHTASDTASHIFEECKNNATGAGTAQRFNLAAFDPIDVEKREAISSCSLAVAPDIGGGSDDNAVSEPPSMEGLLAQLMRHNGELHRQSSGTFGLLFQYLTGIIERQQGQLEKLSGERMMQAETMESLMSRKHQREMETKQLESDMKRKDDMFGKVMSLVPVAVNKLAGKEIVRQNDTLLEVVASEFVGTLTGPKLDALVSSGLFEKHQLTLLLTMLEQVSKRMVSVDEKSKGAQTAQKAVTNGLLDTLVSIGAGK